MGFSVEQECPQCGGTIELDEADRFFRCPYCNVNSLVANPDHFRFVLPTKPGAEPLIHAPYLRFKGSAFTCKGQEIQHRILDLTHPGFQHPRLPASLGLRPQAMKLKFAGPGITGSFLPCHLSREQVLEKIASPQPNSLSNPILHQAYIGDSASIIYLPLTIKGDTLHDMVTDTALGRLADNDPLTSLEALAGPMTWQPTMLSTLCPNCGWNLAGERDSLVLFCPNCETAWETHEGGFQQIPYLAHQDGPAEASAIILPFWKIEATSDGIEIHNLADYLRVTNQPRIIQPTWEKTAMYFLCPAFKIRPKIFLRLAGQLTMAQHLLPEGVARLARRIQAVNLPKSEAVQSLKIILAATAVSKKNLFPQLPATQFKVQSISLILLPFRDLGPGFYQERLKINVNKQTLEFGRYL